MNKRSIRWIALALAATLTLPVLASCDSSDTPDKTKESTSGTTDAVTTTPSEATTSPVVTTPPTVAQTPDINVASLYSAQVALESFISNFATKRSSTLLWNKAPYSRSTGDKWKFWQNAEIFEVLVDYAGVLDDEVYDEYVKSAYTSFKREQGDYKGWTSNAFNDDLMWITIGTAKAYLYTGDEEYKKCATSVFNATFARAWTSTYGGGLIWKEGETSKNSCVEFPAAIAACLLYKIYGDDTKINMVNYPAGDTKATKVTYLEAAQAIYGWAKGVLRVNDPKDRSYGKVFDNINAGANGQINTGTWDGTYNQGTFIGAASLLYELTGDASYLEDAKATFHYTALVKYGQRTPINDECNGDDLPGFKGIMMRWICYFIKNHYDEIKDDMTKEMAWVTRNVNTAWKNRNDKNIIWTAWGTKTNDTMKGISVQGDGGVDCYSCWGCSSALALLINYPYDLLPVK